MTGPDDFDDALRELLRSPAAEAAKPDDRFVVLVTKRIRRRERFRRALLMGMGSAGAVMSLLAVIHLASTTAGSWPMLPEIGHGSGFVPVLLAILLAFAIVDEVRDARSDA